MSTTLMSFEVSYDRDIVQEVSKLPAEDAIAKQSAPSTLVDNSNPIQTTETLHTIPCMAGSSSCKDVCTGIQMESGLMGDQVVAQVPAYNSLLCCL
jgi:hypothetical protein